MVSREHRFHGLGSLRFVYGRGEIERGPVFLIKYVRNSRRDTYRVAVVVSKKVSKSAVVRNRIRRRLYEIIRDHQDNIKEPFDIVITVHNESVADMPSEKLKAQLLKQLKTASIL